MLLLLTLRLTGKRQLEQFTAFDFAVLLIVSNAVQNAMIGPDTSLVGGIVGAATLLGLNYLLSLLSTRHNFFQRELFGVPTLLINDRDGDWIVAHEGAMTLLGDDLRLYVGQVDMAWDVHLSVVVWGKNL